MTAVRVCMDLSPDAVMLVMLYIKSIEICNARLMRGEMPGDKAADGLLSCILNELEAAFTGQP